MPEHNTGIYLISPPQLILEDFLPELEEALKTGYIDVFQLRLKNIGEASLLTIAKAIVESCHRHGVMCLVNDHPNIALAAGADGVHLGKNDMGYQEARKILGPGKMIGVSCYNSVDDAITAAEAGADYVAFGAFFPTHTKEGTTPADPKILRWWTENSTVPCVAIGGINNENTPQILGEGTDFVAVISYVWQHPKGAKYAIEQLHKALGKS